MDAHQIFGYGVTGAGLSYSSSYPPIPSISNSRLFGLNFDIEISRSTIPSPSYSTPVDCDSLTTLSDRQDQSSSTENHSAVSPTESNSYFQQPGPPVDCRIDSLRFLSGGSSLQDVNCRQNMQHTLQQLETALMAPDDEGGVSASGTTSGEGSSSQRSGQRSRAWGQDRQASHVIQTSFLSDHAQLPEGSPVENIHKTTERETSQAVPPGNLKQLLIECAIALSENRISDFDMLIDKARESVFINGDPMQRLGAYLVEGLVARKELSGANIYHGLRCREPESKDLLSYMQILYEICPYLKFGYMAANGAIAETCRNEDRIHIIDFQIAQGTQWVTLLQALAARPGGPPHVRITGIDDPISKYARNSGLEAVGKRLAAMSERFNIPIEFHGVPVFAPDVTRDMLDIRPGEALAVNFPLQLHHTPDESVDVNNPRDELLRLVRSLNPKVTTLVEQESNTNTTPFLNRFVETLDYYLALFESIDVTMPRDQKERIGVEQHCLARDIVNIIACEGKERVERHELFGKWKSRLTMAGFRQYPLSSYVSNVMRGLLKCYSDHYTLVEKDGAMLLGWKKRSLISASAWH